MEVYGQPRHRDIAAAAGLSTITVPVDGHGAMIDELADAAAVLLTPAHQFPLGAALASHRRSRVVAWADATTGLIIEDDYDGEFRYDRQPVGAVQALAPERVAYAGSASKALAPGLRLGWLALPAALVDDVVAVKTLTDRNTSSLSQLTFAEFITSGQYDRQVRRSRLVYRRRRDRLVDALHQHTPGCRSPASRPARTCCSNYQAAKPNTTSSHAPPATASPSKGSAPTAEPPVRIRPHWWSATARRTNMPLPGPSHDSPPYSPSLPDAAAAPQAGFRALTDPGLRTGRAGGGRGGRARCARRTRCGTGRGAAGWG